MAPTWVFIILAVLNVIAFLLFVLDKAKAKLGAWRISEATLLIFAFFGAIGATLGMLLAHHKVSKTKFKLVYVFLVINIAVIIALCFI